MTDMADRLAVDFPVLGHAARVGAVLAQRLDRRRPVPATDRIQAMLAQTKALGRRHSGLGRGIAPQPAARRSTQERITAYRTPLLAQRSGPETAPAGMRRRMQAAPTIRAAPGAKAHRGEKSLLAEPRLALSMLAQHRPRRPGGPTERPGARAPAVIAVLGPRLAAPVGQRLAARAAMRSDTPYRMASPTAPAPATGARHRHAVPAGQQTTAPGFHRTVRPPQSKPAAGHVYLDKALVGYHLVAAITAEQTRAAGRPNISGSSFNRSMAALRPSGTGL